MTNKSKGYLGNQNLKEAGIDIQFTEEQVIEYMKCAKDPVYFIEKYIKVVSLDEGLVPFKLYDFQEDMVQTVHDNRFTIAKLPRQSGKSTTMVAYMLHYIMFNQNMNVAILANKQSVAKDILSRLQLTYEYLPLWLQQGIVEWNKASVKLENGSRVIASSTSSSAIRGGSYNCISDNSKITIRNTKTGEIINTTIGEFYANSSRNSNNYKYLYENDEQQIQEMVFFSDEESTISSIRERNNNRKSSHNSKIARWNEQEEQYSFIDNQRTSSCTQIAPEVFRKYREGKNGTCPLSDGKRTTRKDGIAVQFTTEDFNGTIFGSEENFENRHEAFRRNKKKNIRVQQRKETIRRSKEKTIYCDEGEIKGYQKVGRFLQESFCGVERQEENQRTYGENKQKSRKDSQNRREAPWNETKHGSKTKNERIRKSKNQEAGWGLEQRNEICEWEVYTDRGFRKFYGVSKTHNQQTIRIETEVDEIVCTPDHKIATIDGFIEAKEISYGSKIQTTDGFVDVVCVEDGDKTDVYDLLNVEETHSFYANGLLVHNCILLDEFAHVPTNIAEEFFNSVYPTISAGQNTKVIMISTPNGLNMFYYYWKGATKKPGEDGKNDYIPIEVQWDEVPQYPGGPLRDEKWKEDTIANTSAEQFQQEFICDFLGSQNTLISSAKLRVMNWATPKTKDADGLWIYEDPKEDRDYFITVDTSRGQGKDYSAFVVVDATDMPYKMVARYRNNTISPMVYPTVIRAVATKYNKASVLIEINDIGGQVADILHQDLEYENVMMTTYKGRAGQVMSGGFGGSSSQSQLGVRTTMPVKKLGCSILKSLIEEDKLLVEDVDTINELITFIAKKNSFEADDGHTDDLVMSLVLFAWMTRQDYFKSITDADIRTQIYEEKIRDIEDELMPFGFIADEAEEGEWDGEDRWFSM